MEETKFKMMEFKIKGDGIKSFVGLAAMSSTRSLSTKVTHSSCEQSLPGVAGGQDDQRQSAGDLDVYQRPLPANFIEYCLGFKTSSMWRFIKKRSFQNFLQRFSGCCFSLTISAVGRRRCGRDSRS